MKIYSVYDKEFKPYGKVLEGFDTAAPSVTAANEEDRMLWARNKWLLAHPESDEAESGAYIGLTGENIDLA